VAWAEAPTHHLFPHPNRLAAGSLDRRSCPPWSVGFGIPIASPKNVAACPFEQPVPRSGAAAIRAEVKADLEAAIGVTLINLVLLTIDTQLSIEYHHPEIA